MIDNITVQPILYGPQTGKSLLRLYPELSKEEEFKNLSASDLLFSWYMGIKGSPISEDMTPDIRRRTAASKVYRNDDDKRRVYGVDGNLTDEIKIAIKKFEMMSPDARLIAKHMTQKTFEKFQQLLDVDVDKDFLITKKIGKGDDAEEITEIDWSGRKSYVDSATKIIESLPELIKKIEEGYGITEQGTSAEGLGNKTIDKYHQSQTNR